MLVCPYVAASGNILQDVDSHIQEAKIELLNNRISDVLKPHLCITVLATFSVFLEQT
jgi:hypothetical protein